MIQPTQNNVPNQIAQSLCARENNGKLIKASRFLESHIHCASAFSENMHKGRSFQEKNLKHYRCGYLVRILKHNAPSILPYFQSQVILIRRTQWSLPKFRGETGHVRHMEVK